MVIDQEEPDTPEVHESNAVHSVGVAPREEMSSTRRLARGRKQNCSCPEHQETHTGER